MLPLVNSEATPLAISTPRPIRKVGRAAEKRLLVIIAMPDAMNKKKNEAKETSVIFFILTTIPSSEGDRTNF